MLEDEKQNETIANKGKSVKNKVYAREWWKGKGKWVTQYGRAGLEGCGWAVGPLALTILHVWPGELRGCWACHRWPLPDDGVSWSPEAACVYACCPNVITGSTPAVPESVWMINFMISLCTLHTFGIVWCACMCVWEGNKWTFLNTIWKYCFTLLLGFFGFLTFLSQKASCFQFAKPKNMLLLLLGL